MAKVYLEYLQQKQIKTLLWPSKSPDLNPIDRLWDGLKRCLRSRQQAPRNFQQLSEAILNEWNNIHQHKARRVITSMRKRCETVIDAQGGHTRY